MPGPVSLTTWLARGRRAVPATRFASGVLAIFAAAAAVRGFFPGVSLTAMLLIFGSAIMAMTLLLIFAALAERPEDLAPPAKVLVWTVTLLLVSVVTLGLTTIVFGWPPRLAQAFDANPAPERSGAEPTKNPTPERQTAPGAPSPSALAPSGSATADPTTIAAAPTTKSTPAPNSAETLLPDRYEKPNGRIEKRGDIWYETDEKVGIEIPFEEMQHTSEMTILYDKSRDLYLRFPSQGGYVEWSNSNPMRWTQLYVVKPVS